MTLVFEITVSEEKIFGDVRIGELFFFNDVVYVKCTLLVAQPINKPGERVSVLERQQVYSVIINLKE